jgi:ribosomal protein S27AE
MNSIIAVIFFLAFIGYMAWILRVIYLSLQRNRELDKILNKDHIRPISGIGRLNNMCPICGASPIVITSGDIGVCPQCRMSMGIEEWRKQK